MKKSLEYKHDSKEYKLITSHGRLIEEYDCYRKGDTYYAYITIEVTAGEYYDEDSYEFLEIPEFLIGTWTDGVNHIAYHGEGVLSGQLHDLHKVLTDEQKEVEFKEFTSDDEFCSILKEAWEYDSKNNTTWESSKVKIIHDELKNGLK